MNFVRGVPFALAAFLAVPSLARAHGGGGKLPPEPRPVAEEGKRAKVILDRLEADPASVAVIKPRIEAGKKALARAYAASLANDSEAARELSRIALAEAAAAEATASSAREEARATRIAARVATLRTRTKEVKAAVDELEVERTRLKLEIQKLRTEEAARRAVATRKELDDGKKKPKAAPKKEKKRK